jgi:hypothetical protein
MFLRKNKCLRHADLHAVRIITQCRIRVNARSPSARRNTKWAKEIRGTTLDIPVIPRDNRSSPACQRPAGASPAFAKIPDFHDGVSP